MSKDLVELNCLGSNH